MDLVAATVAGIVCALAVIVVTVDRIAWELGYNGQLIVVGLLIGIMSICLKFIVPTLFLMCEITFGNSTIQNIDAIRTNSSLATKVDWWWRFALLLLIALPLALSVAYKQFFNGSAAVGLGAEHFLYNNSFGIHPPPGLLPLGWNTGLLLMFNATMPFLTQSTNQSAITDAEYNNTANDVPQPMFPQAFGYNTLVIDKNTTAILDVPHPQWVEKVQAEIGEGNMLEVGANVLALFTTYDASVDDHRSSISDNWWSNNSMNSTWEIDYHLIFTWYLWLRYYPPPDFDPRAAATFISIHNLPDPPQPDAKLFATTRRQCYGRWNITQTTATLMNSSSCSSEPLTSSDSLLQDTSHLILTNFTGLALKQFYPPILAEILAPFITRSTSEWFTTTMATAVGAMYWSRIAAAAGLSSPHWQPDDSFTNDARDNPYIVHDATLSYTSSPDISWTTPAMRKSAWLFVVIGIQPAITLIMLVAIAILRKVPVGKGFGMVAILAGVKAESLGLLKGAEVSGELEKEVYLGASKETEGREKLEYFLSVERVPDDERLK
ncbi:hypothetical protein HII31_03511 [Pseudocercospora fuligena]|uniref:Uncharacterized protein n=1 Tax=Pseudocercospora fuligena TaxID=685502 RepID=A0A8H6VQL0_9PEZI|nr:hypothetical protein HII31_03511 [Pseudocercospora fuligena]